MSDKGMRLEEARTNNILTSKPSSSGKMEEYYSYMIRQEKLKQAASQNQITTGEQTALNKISQLDQLELKALARLYQLSDNSPELLQYFAITHCSTREEVAAKLAKKQLRKQLVEEAVNKVLDPGQVATAVNNSLNATRAARGSGAGFGLGALSQL
jgi:hypothetical protein